VIPVGLPLRQPSIPRSARTGPAPRAGRFFVACRQRCPDGMVVGHCCMMARRGLPGSTCKCALPGPASRAGLGYSGIRRYRRGSGPRPAGHEEDVAPLGLGQPVALRHRLQRHGGPGRVRGLHTPCSHCAA